jgi:hypothetical protein
MAGRRAGRATRRPGGPSLKGRGGPRIRAIRVARVAGRPGPPSGAPADPVRRSGAASPEPAPPEEADQVRRAAAPGRPRDLLRPRPSESAGDPDRDGGGRRRRIRVIRIIRVIRVIRVIRRQTLEATAAGRALRGVQLRTRTTAGV